MVKLKAEVSFQRKPVTLRWFLRWEGMWEFGAVEIAKPLFGAEVPASPTYTHHQYSGVGSKVIIANNWFLPPHQPALTASLMMGPDRLLAVIRLPKRNRIQPDSCSLRPKATGGCPWILKLSPRRAHFLALTFHPGLGVCACKLGGGHSSLPVLHC